MLKNDNFKRLFAVWKHTGSLSLPKSVDVFYLSQWVTRSQELEAAFGEELEDNLLNASKEEEVKYLTYIVTKLTALPEILANLPTAASTNLLAAFKTGRPFKHTAFYRQVSAALTAAGKSAASSPYDDETIARPFQNEYVQAAFLTLYARLSKDLQKLVPPQPAELLAPTAAAPLILKVDMADLLDLLEIMKERGDWVVDPKVNEKALCQSIAALFRMPASKKGAKSPDWKRFYDLMLPQEADESRTRTNRSKKGLYDAIKPAKPH